MIKVNTKWMEKALFLAQKAASLDEVPVGAVVVYEDQIIAKGYNQREKKNSPLAHAELIALEKAAQRRQSWRLNGCILVTTLEPCLMCLAACQQARIDHVLYGALDPKGGAISLGYPFHTDVRTHHRFHATYVENRLCGEILTDFFRAKRRG